MENYTGLSETALKDYATGFLIYVPLRAVCKEQGITYTQFCILATLDEAGDWQPMKKTRRVSGVDNFSQFSKLLSKTKGIGTRGTESGREKILRIEKGGRRMMDKILIQSSPRHIPVDEYKKGFHRYIPLRNVCRFYGMNYTGFCTLYMMEHSDSRTIKELMESIGMRDRSLFTTTVLNPLSKHGFAGAEIDEEDANGRKIVYATQKGSDTLEAIFREGLQASQETSQ